MLGNPLNLACQFRYSGIGNLSILDIFKFYMIANQFKLGNS
jgi:hypothetical protein